MTKQLLIDTFSVKFSLTESKNGRAVGKGVFARAGIPTANRRVYPESVWRKNINKLLKDMKERKTYGELDHPEDGKTKLQRVSHLMTDLKLESDGTIIGEMEVIPGTPNGDILNALIDANCTIGVSSRGYGSVKMNESGHDVVQDDYVLMTFDAVSDPANATSWPEFSQEGEAEESKKVDEKIITETGKKEANMAEEKQESPKKAAEELPVIPSPKPNEPAEEPKKYYGVFLKNDKDEYDNTVPKFIYTNKEDADEMAKELTTNNQEKNVFVAKEIEYSEALKTEEIELDEKASKETVSYHTLLIQELRKALKTTENLKIADVNYNAKGINGYFLMKEPKGMGETARRYHFAIQKEYTVTPDLPESVEEGIEDIKPWLSDIEGVISDLEFYLPKTSDKSEHSKMQRMLVSLKAVKNMLAEMKEDNEKLTVAAKEMGFRYFLEKNLSHHPKYQEILQGLGKLTKYESIEEIKNLVKLHIEDANEFVKTKQVQIEHKLQKIENEFTMKTEESRQAIKAKEAIVECKEQEIKSLRDDLAQLQSELTAEKTKVYLERKIQGLSNAFAIREAYEKSGIVGNKIVDRLVESMSQPKEMVTEASVFNQVRSSLGKRQLPNNKLVEDAVKGTTQASVKKLTEEHNPINLSIAEFNKLAGL